MTTRDAALIAVGAGAWAFAVEEGLPFDTEEAKRNRNVAAFWIGAAAAAWLAWKRYR